MFEFYIAGYVVEFIFLLVGGTILVVEKKTTLGELLFLLLFIPPLSWVIVVIGIIYISYNICLDREK